MSSRETVVDKITRLNIQDVKIIYEPGSNILGNNGVSRINYDKYSFIY